MKFLDLLAGTSCDNFATLKGVELEHLAHLLLFQVVDAVFSCSGLLLNVRQVTLDLVEVVKGHRELVKVLGKLTSQVFFNNVKLSR